MLSLKEFQAIIAIIWDIEEEEVVTVDSWKIEGDTITITYAYSTYERDGMVVWDLEDKITVSRTHLLGVKYHRSFISTYKIRMHQNKIAHFKGVLERLEDVCQKSIRDKDEVLDKIRKEKIKIREIRSDWGEPLDES